MTKYGEGDHMDPGTRSVWLAKRLDEHGVPEYGRAASISKKVGCSNAVAQGWLGGSLAKDMVQGLKFCDAYGFTVREWVTGEAAQSEDKLSFINSVRLAKQFEEDTGYLNVDQFVMVTELIIADSEKGEVLANNLTAIAKIVKTGK